MLRSLQRVWTQDLPFKAIWNPGVLGKSKCPGLRIRVKDRIVPEAMTIPFHIPSWGRRGGWMGTDPHSFLLQSLRSQGAGSQQAPKQKKPVRRNRELHCRWSSRTWASHKGESQWRQRKKSNKAPQLAARVRKDKQQPEQRWPSGSNQGQRSHLKHIRQKCFRISDYKSQPKDLNFLKFSR